jgi:signal transduction histidine kinase
MADPYEHLRRVALFADLPEHDLATLLEASSELALSDGEALFTQGDKGDAAYVITGGAIEIVKEGPEKDTLLALRKPGEVIGEMALLAEEPRMATARARDDATVIAVPKPAMTHLLDVSPTAVRGLFDIVLDRLRSTQALMKQNERMAQLGTLSAGVAHELNNPAGAVLRAAGQLDAGISDYARAIARAASVLDKGALTELDHLTDRPPATAGLSALERSDIEADMEAALQVAGVNEPWTVAADLVDAGNDTGDHDSFDIAGLGPAVEALGAGRAVASLVRSISEGADRLSAIVGALKSYSFLDRAPVQDVDMTKGLEDTLLILGDKLKGVSVERDYAPDLRAIEANGSELNQVWTNLLDNAADAIHERLAGDDDTPGRITIRAHNTDSGIVVEVTDNGDGIPEAIIERIFDSFFTTKEPGKGTGLGLDISRQIVVLGHRGDLTVDSEPGRTTFRVELPAQAA